MKIMLDPGAFRPERAHPTDAGLDIRAMDKKTIPGKSSVIFRTGVHVQLPAGCAGLLVSKSGLNVNHGITSTGLIDEGYTGEILVRLYNHFDTEYTVNPGDKITQLVVMPVRYEDVELVPELQAGGERGDKGFGSSGR